MEPVFTLQWPEFLLAEKLQRYFPKSKGFSLLVPLSRQEKDVDLALLRKNSPIHAVVTFQIKASRTYIPEPPKRTTTKRFIYNTWFRACLKSK